MSLGVIPYPPPSKGETKTNGGWDLGFPFTQLFLVSISQSQGVPDHSGGHGWRGNT